MLAQHERLVLEIVGQSDGRLDTRHLDFEYYSRSRVLLQPNLLQVLRRLEQRGLVESVTIEGGTGPGWQLTDDGRQSLLAVSRRSCLP